MEISITAVTGNRKFGKALVRHATALERLRRAALDVNTSGLPFDVLQLVFMDRSDEDDIEGVGTKKGDRLYQVQVSIPSEDRVDYGNATAFVGCVAQRLKAAASACGLPVSIESRLIEAIDRAGVGEH